MITTTLNKIRDQHPCEDGWVKLLKHLNKTKALDAAHLKFSTILESNGLDDTIWCLRTIRPKHDKEVRLFAADCAERVLHIYEAKYPIDMRVRECIKASRLFANGEITEKELKGASLAAYSAYSAAAATSAAVLAAYSAYSTAVSPAFSASYAARAAVDTEAEEEVQKKLLIERFG